MFIDYQYLLIPFIAAFSAQCFKMIVNAAKGRFTFRDLINYGGMPSGHAAAVTALAAMVGYFEGWTTASFGIAMVLAVIVIRDAGGFRRLIGEHAEQINLIVKKSLGSTIVLPVLKEKVGHTPLELFFGCLIGIVATTVYVLLK
jgi:acid phosphatase family membrane protein YuiD